MQLSTWIKSQGGVTAAGRLLGVGHNTVQAWLVGRSMPRPVLMQRIVKLTRGRVGYDDMINAYKLLRAKRRPLKKKTAKKKR